MLSRLPQQGIFVARERDKAIQIAEERNKVMSTQFCPIINGLCKESCVCRKPATVGTLTQEKVIIYDVECTHVLICGVVFVGK